VAWWTSTWSRWFALSLVISGLGSLALVALMLLELLIGQS
jgi:hypothetical protein